MMPSDRNGKARLHWLESNCNSYYKFVLYFQVKTGELPADFLRIGGGPALSQEAMDRQAAMALQQRYNANAAVAVAAGPGYSAFVPPNTRGRLNITIAQVTLSKKVFMKAILFFILGEACQKLWVSANGSILSATRWEWGF